ncbi:DMT family transporter [Gracilibacillus kekensis]|uniref:Paired small multidrug resistance pump n=1 Tax=Gracilibacillus kekensis TaxID=1027249 RepID=A0A1M7JHJ9_9BACI|nr:multidrug efflux SMR transporter [Gracilibacillus kekensis]SHM52391.1 paired small multidrug resistance pump [Gracilibacillus kekensis]
MDWFVLILAGLFEMFAVMMMNQWHHDKAKVSLILMIASFAASFFFLSLAMKSLPMSLAYAIWTGIGAAGGALIGILIYNESKNPKRLFFLALIIVSVIGLKIL